MGTLHVRSCFCPWQRYDAIGDLPSEAVGSRSLAAGTAFLTAHRHDEMAQSVDVVIGVELWLWSVGPGMHC
jgi:hypothetical protein